MDIIIKEIDGAGNYKIVQGLDGYTVLRNVNTSSKGGNHRVHTVGQWVDFLLRLHPGATLHVRHD